MSKGSKLSGSTPTGRRLLRSPQRVKSLQDHRAILCKHSPDAGALGIAVGADPAGALGGGDHHTVTQGHERPGRTGDQRGGDGGKCGSRYRSSS